jgi:hypothetical protein
MPPDWTSFLLNDGNTMGNDDKTRRGKSISNVVGAGIVGLIRPLPIALPGDADALVIRIIREVSLGLKKRLCSLF